MPPPCSLLCKPGDSSWIGEAAGPCLLNLGWEDEMLLSLPALPLQTSQHHPVFQLLHRRYRSERRGAGGGVVPKVQFRGGGAKRGKWEENLADPPSSPLSSPPPSLC